MTPERLSFGTVKEHPTVSESHGIVKFLRALGDIPVSTVTVCTEKKCVKGKKLQVKLDSVVGWWDGGCAMNEPNKKPETKGGEMNWTPSTTPPVKDDIYLAYFVDGEDQFSDFAGWTGTNWVCLEGLKPIVGFEITHWMKIEPPTV